MSARSGAGEFLAAFEALAQAVRRARGGGAQEGTDRLSLSQYSLISPLGRTGGARVSQLAAEVGVAPSTATRILDALERRGLVRRVRLRQDRRGVVVSLTPDGEEALRRQDEWMRDRQLGFYSGLPDQERELVADLLLRLAALIDELSAGPVG